MNSTVTLMLTSIMSGDVCTAEAALEAFLGGGRCGAVCPHCANSTLRASLGPVEKGVSSPRKAIPGGRSSPVCNAKGEVLCPGLKNVIVLRKLWRTLELGPREPAEVVPMCPV